MSIVIPPIKCQGKKSELVPFIIQNIKWSNTGNWIEPFLGSGVVAFNMTPKNAILCDTNKHIINLYLKIQSGEITPTIVRDFLETNGKELSEKGKLFFYKIRERFNRYGDPLDFLFINRSCFNGLMRFNSSGAFNVAFCKKDNRFSKAYITKIVNQVKSTADIIQTSNWIFKTQDWRETLKTTHDNDFVYLDPPYIGRNTQYYNDWTNDDAIELANTTQKLNCGFAMSMWLSDKYRKNEYISKYWSENIIKTASHFYQVGATEATRHEIEEALIIKNGFDV